MADPWDDPRARAWARDVEANMIPALRASDAVAPVWTGGVDVKMSVEIGAAVLMDKPLIIVVQVGTPVPDKLVRIADRIVEADLSTDEGRRSLATRIHQAMDELCGDRPADG